MLESGPFASLGAVRKANDVLLASLPDSEAFSTRRSTSDRDRIQDFIRRTVETGAILDTPIDRRTAQGLIDYWASNYLLLNDDGTRQTMAGRSSMALKPFDANAVDSAAKRGEEVFKLLSRSDQELARWILLRLFRLSDTGNNCEPISASVETLLALGNSEKVHSILDRLTDAGLIIMTSGDQGSLVQIRYDALTRRWDRLRSWIEERIKFRDAALFWLRSSKAPGALLGGSLWKDAKAYGALNEVEQDFVAQSRRRNHLLRYVAIGFALLLLLAPAFYQQLREDIYVPWVAKSWNESIKNTTDPKTIRDGIRWLADNGQRVILSSYPISKVDLTGLDLVGSQFIQSNLKSMTFTKASLTFANFREGVIVDSKFDGAKLDTSRFSDATIARTSFADASLHQAIFDRALFCENVDFSAADVRSASFRNVVFDGDNVPLFKGTAWWLATGWTTRQVEKLIAKTDGKETYTNSRPFKVEAEFDEQGLKIVTAPTAFRAGLLNGKAWNLATYGVDLKDAEVASRESLHIMQSVIADANAEKSPTASYRQSLASYEDTLAYILLQTGQPGSASEAAQDWREAIAGTPNPLSEWIFRYAVALFVEGQNDEAMKELTLAMDVNNYYPSHELYLLWPYINKQPFRSRVEELMKKSQPSQPLPSRACPSATAG